MGRDDEVGRQRERAADPGRGPVDGRDDGLRHVADRVDDRVVALAQALREVEVALRRPPSPRCPRASRSRSAPDEKARPAPVMSTARTASSVATDSSAARRSSPSWKFHALRASGRFSSTVATPSATSTLTVSNSGTCFLLGLWLGLGDLVVAAVRVHPVGDAVLPSGTPSALSGAVIGRYHVVTGISSTTRTKCGRAFSGRVESASLEVGDE